jgi:hypothetical protein
METHLEHPTPNIQHRTPNAERQLQSIFTRMGWAFFATKRPKEHKTEKQAVLIPDLYPNPFGLSLCSL